MSTQAPVRVRLRYPDLDTFRNATGEPGTVAGFTEGRRIHLQPTATLRAHGTLERTIRHELFHVWVESQRTASLPMWFREGLVEYLAGEIPPGSRLPRLVQQYGLTAVLGWLRTGMPGAESRPDNPH